MLTEGGVSRSARGSRLGDGRITTARQGILNKYLFFLEFQKFGFNSRIRIW